jgi:hypothetical protein
MRLEAPGDAAAAGRHARGKPLGLRLAVSHDLLNLVRLREHRRRSDKITIADAAATANLRKAIGSLPLKTSIRTAKKSTSAGERKGLTTDSRNSAPKVYVRMGSVSR